jgi:hypothetical protein
VAKVTPAQQFQITPEMVAVGASCVEAWDHELSSLEARTPPEFAKFIYAQMRRMEPVQKSE